MFDAIPDFASINKISDLRQGTYSKVCSEYQNAGGTAAILINEYRYEFEEAPCVIDLIVIDNMEFVRAADFIQIQSGQWRTSTGQVGPTLADVLPPELETFRLVEETKSGDVYVGDGRFYIL
ncbi:hypothetical protein [Herbaspirillum sp. RV1423]|uniref:hypothetical protein n=1 Tax=Herbaspirillum sp. RV1423 TaxID=1443993 RepID=UPI00054E4673|nr:hypothetical protein [Herbaspirillum sp. RV1423]